MKDSLFTVFTFIQNKDDKLTIKVGHKELVWDASSFRPQLPQTKKFVRAYVLFDFENLWSGELITFPFQIVLNKKVYTNIR